MIFGQNKMQRFDPKIRSMIPHREPMLLINQLVEVDQKHSKASVIIDQETPFFESGKGVPAWIGLEYMGQTAALIAGHQVQEGLSEPHLGFLMGSRKFETEVEYFEPNTNLLVSCEEAALVGESLATFNCTISNFQTGAILATALLSVFRKPL